MIGMEQNNHCLGCDTKMCGDPVSWFPMGVTYSRELKVKAELDRTAQQEHAIMTVPDFQMHNFMHVASKIGDSVLFFNGETVVGKEGKRVLITGGVFNGVTGVIRRVKRCKRVIVELEGIASVAIAFVPAVLIKEIGN